MQRLKIWARNVDKALLHNFSLRIGMSFILTLLHSDSLLMTASTSSGKVSCNDVHNEITLVFTAIKIADQTKDPAVVCFEKENLSFLFTKNV